VLVVTTNELPALEAAQRAITYMESRGVPRSRMHLVLNRYARELGLSDDAVQTALKIDVSQVIPYDYEAVQRSLMDGKPLATNSAIGKSLTALAEGLGGSQGGTRHKTHLGGFLSLFSRA